MKALKITFIALFAAIGFSVNAQCDSIATWCGHNMSDEYISDGQMYRALLYHDQVAEFQMTMFGASTYRIAACSGAEDGNLIFRIFDEEKNELFSNADHLNAPYWDFVVGSSVNCTIEAQLDHNKRESGCAVLLVGFKQ
jgi:hypothetical protein